MKVSLNYRENLHFTAQARHFSNIHLDEPESFHGTDLGPSSVEYFLIGIGGCIGSTFAYCFQLQHMEIQDLDIIVDGKLEHSGPKSRLRLASTKLEISYTLKNEYKQQLVEECIANFQEFCVIKNSILNAFPVQIKIKKKEED